MGRPAAQDGSCGDLTERTKRAQRSQSRTKDWDGPNLAKTVARDKGFTYYGSMNITLSLADDLVKRVRKIAVDRDTTLTGLVRDYLTEMVRTDPAPGRKPTNRNPFQHTFQPTKFNVGKSNSHHA